MVVFKVLLFYACTLTFIGESYSEGCVNDLPSKSAAVRLSNDLFCSYNKNVRPVRNQTTQTVVNTWFYIFHVNMNDHWDLLQISVQLIMSWKDEFLTWDPSKYDNVDIIYEDSDTLWLPEVMSYEMGFSGENTPYSYYLPTSVVKINSTGYVRYNHRITLTAQCSADIAKWPFDSHNCTLLFGSPTYTISYINYTFPNGYYNLDYLNPNKEWELLGVKQECINIFYTTKSNSSRKHCILNYNINIQRFSSMYYSSIIIPAIVISLMRTFTFLMGREVSLRLILLCLFFISELLYLQYINATIPNNGKSRVYIVVMYCNSLMLTAIALVVSVVSNELYKRSTEDFPRQSPMWLKSVSTFLLNIRPITILTNFNNQGAELLIENNGQEETPNSQRDENALFWKTLSVLLDRVSFLTALLISMINFWFLIP